MTLAVRQHGADEARALVEELARVWTEAHPEFGAVADRRGGEFRAQVHGHLRHAGFVLTAAYGSGTLVGFGYGFPCSAAYWYGEELLPRIPAEARQGLMGLCELAVRPGWQSRGIGTRLHEALVEAVAPQWTSLLVDPANHRGRAFYDRLGYRSAGPYRNGGETYDLLIARAHGRS
ncbi:GNAT family N-acetyltransferase [Streptomyces sp. NPDC004031]